MVGWEISVDRSFKIACNLSKSISIPVSTSCTNKRREERRRERGKREKKRRSGSRFERDTELLYTLKRDDCGCYTAFG